MKPRDAKATLSARPERDGSARTGIQVISRAATILRVVGKHPKGLSLSAIAEETDLPRSTVQRIVDALELENFVESSGPAGGTRLGHAMGLLGRQAHGELVALVHPFLQLLSQEVGETVVLGALVGRLAIVIDRVVAEQPLCIMVPVGATSPPYTTAGGKVMLAQHPDGIVRKLLSDTVTPLTENSATDMSSLLEELAEIRRVGLAFDNEEHTLGMCSVGTSIDAFSGVYALSIVAPATRYATAKCVFEAQLLSAKIALEAQLQKRAP